MQQIRLIKPYALHGKGEVLTVDTGVAHELIRVGKAEAVPQVLPPPPPIPAPDLDPNRPFKVGRRKKRK